MYILVACLVVLDILQIILERIKMMIPLVQQRLPQRCHVIDWAVLRPRGHPIRMTGMTVTIVVVADGIRIIEIV